MLAISALRADMTENVASLRADATEQIASLRADMTEQFAEVRTTITGVRTTIMARLDRLQNELTLQQEGLIVDRGNTDRVERIASAARDEVRAVSEQITPLIRQVQRLQADVHELQRKAS